MTIKLDSEDRFVYPSRDEARTIAARFAAYINNFLRSRNISVPVIDDERLYELIVRVEQRRVYFHVFHYPMQMGELNEFVLYAFWILKLCPFNLPNVDPGIFNRDLAFAIFTRAIKAEAKARGKLTNLTSSVSKRLLEDFRYRDLSKEALMTIAETLIVTDNEKRGKK
jgi:hypothetical protein